MNIKENQRTRLSKILLKNALTDILKEKGSVNKVSVRELCERAQLNRSTFYAHYSEPKELLNEIENDLLQSTREHLEKSVRKTIWEHTSTFYHFFSLSKITTSTFAHCL